MGPRTVVAELLTGIWADVLQVEQLGVNDNFFDLVDILCWQRR